MTRPAPRIAIGPIEPGSPDIAACARWRIEAFGGTLGRNVADEEASLASLVADPRAGVALVARIEGVLAGTCLLVPSEIDPLHQLTPWLAGLYVATEQRRHGVGAALVRAIERVARQRGHDRLHLYTDNAEPFYVRLGWQTIDRFDWKGKPAVLMVRAVHGVMQHN